MLEEAGGPGLADGRMKLIDDRFWGTSRAQDGKNWSLSACRTCPSASVAELTMGFPTSTCVETGVNCHKISRPPARAAGSDGYQRYDKGELGFHRTTMNQLRNVCNWEARRLSFTAMNGHQPLGSLPTCKRMSGAQRRSRHLHDFTRRYGGSVGGLSSRGWKLSTAHCRQSNRSQLSLGLACLPAYRRFCHSDCRLSMPCCCQTGQCGRCHAEL